MGTRTVALLLLLSVPAAAQPRQRVLLLDRSPLGAEARLRQQVINNLQNGLETSGYTVEARARSTAAPGGPSIESLLAQARTHSEQFREKEALAAIERAEQVFRAGFGRKVSVQPLVLVLLARARLSSETGKKDDVESSFRRALVINPELTLDPGVFPPQLIAAFKRLKAQVGRQTASLQVVTMPGGQPVWVDGRPRGRAPVSVAVPAGEHFVAAGPKGATGGRVVQVNAVTRITIAAQQGARKLTAQRARNMGQQAGADWVVTFRLVPLRGDRFQVRTSTLPVRTVDVPRSLRSQTVAEAQLVWATSQLGVKLQGLLRGASGPTPRPTPVAQDNGKKGGSVFKTWWFWTIVAAVVGGGTATAVVLTRDNEQGVRVTVQR